MPKVRSDRKKYHIMANSSDTNTVAGTTLNPNASAFQTTQLGATQNSDLENLIRQIVKDTLTKSNTELVDETITDRTNLEGLDRIPDIVKAIREFDGNANEYTAWRKSVERIIDLYGNLKNTAKYFGIVSVIRNKIIGQANIALESYNTPLNWVAIKNCLNNHYADKRDIGTLDYQLMTLTQGNNTIEQFYQKVYNHFSLILNHISGLELDKNVETTLITSYRNKTLDTFIRGLNGDLPRLLAVKEPQNLPEALYLCTKLANQNFRSNYANQRQYTPPQQQKNLPWQKNNFSNSKSFVPQLAHFGERNHQPQNSNPNYQQIYFQKPPNQQFQQTPHQTYPTQWQNPPIVPFGRNHYTPPRPTAPKPEPRPEPMDIDASMRSQTINYANRPKNQDVSGKRPLQSQQTYQQPKQTRYFHIYNNEDNNINTLETDQTQNNVEYEETMLGLM